MASQLGVWFLIAFLSTLSWQTTNAACHTCHTLLPASFRQARRVPHGIGFATLKQAVEKRPVLVASVVVAHRVWGSRAIQTLWSDKDANGEESWDDSNPNLDEAQEAPAEEENNMSAAMIATIGVYKNFISPLLPPACRFLPTCSQYGVQAIQEFGPCKGGVLTGWRLMRCSPFGGKGYDPPKWPPVSYTYGSY